MDGLGIHGRKRRMRNDDGTRDCGWSLRNKLGKVKLAATGSGPVVVGNAAPFSYKITVFFSFLGWMK